jgi:HD-GYP domain-containing protein (c-di-GMP phosphodiesterase class II)
MAMELSLTPTEVEHIELAGLLHAVGKIGIPDEILKKSESDMVFEEEEIYRQYPIRGQAAVDPVEDLRASGLLIRHHRERFDGKGFPGGFKGTDIPLGSRIIAVAALYDEVFASKLFWDPVEAALKKLRKQGEGSLDPALMDVLEKVLRSSTRTPRPSSAAVERRITPAALVSGGMWLSRDLHTGTGVLVARAGALVDDAMVAAIRRFYSIDPPKDGLYVLVNG